MSKRPQIAWLRKQTGCGAFPAAAAAAAHVRAQQDTINIHFSPMELFLRPSIIYKLLLNGRSGPYAELLTADSTLQADALFGKGGDLVVGREKLAQQCELSFGQAEGCTSLCALTVSTHSVKDLSADAVLVEGAVSFVLPASSDAVCLTVSLEFSMAFTYNAETHWLLASHVLTAAPDTPQAVLEKSGPVKQSGPVNFNSSLVADLSFQQVGRPVMVDETQRLQLWSQPAIIVKLMNRGDRDELRRLMTCEFTYKASGAGNDEMHGKMAMDALCSSCSNATTMTVSTVTLHVISTVMVVAHACFSLYSERGELIEAGELQFHFTLLTDNLWMTSSGCAAFGSCPHHWRCAHVIKHIQLTQLHTALPSSPPGQSKTDRSVPGLRGAVAVSSFAWMSDLCCLKPLQLMRVFVDAFGGAGPSSAAVTAREQFQRRSRDDCLIEIPAFRVHMGPKDTQTAWRLQRGFFLTCHSVSTKMVSCEVAMAHGGFLVASHSQLNGSVSQMGQFTLVLKLSPGGKWLLTHIVLDHASLVT